MDTTPSPSTKQLERVEELLAQVGIASAIEHNVIDGGAGIDWSRDTPAYRDPQSIARRFRTESDAAQAIERLETVNPILGHLVPAYGEHITGDGIVDSRWPAERAIRVFTFGPTPMSPALSSGQKVFYRAFLMEPAHRALVRLRITTDIMDFSLQQPSRRNTENYAGYFRGFSEATQWLAERGLAIEEWLGTPNAAWTWLNPSDSSEAWPDLRPETTTEDTLYQLRWGANTESVDDPVTGAQVDVQFLSSWTGTRDVGSEGGWSWEQHPQFEAIILHRGRAEIAHEHALRAEERLARTFTADPQYISVLSPVGTHIRRPIPTHKI